MGDIEKRNKSNSPYTKTELVKKELGMGKEGTKILFSK